MTKNFSWIKELKSFENNESNTKNFINLLRKEKIHGFEIEIIGRKISQLKNHNLNKTKIAILSNCATQPLANATRVACLQEHLYAEIYEGPIGAIHQELIDLNSCLYKFKPEIILLDINAYFFNIFDEMPMEEDLVKKKLDNDCKKIYEIWDLISSLKSKIIQTTLVLPQNNFSGLAEYKISWGINNYINKLNKKIVNSSKDVIWIDTNKLSQIIGLKNWHDLSIFYQAKYGFSQRYLPEFTNWLTTCVREIYAIKPKVLILDLDNTLWGGIIGDDGLEGIKLGPETPEGEAFKDFCKYLKSLNHRGVILAICSKNEISNVEEVFNNHPHMPLKINNFSCIKCNWENKSKNILDISKELNLDISSFVFVDDNPAECELVRNTLSEVRVVELSEDPSKHIEKIDLLNLFNSESLSKEDLKRQKSYSANAKFQLEKTNSIDIEHYLLSMNMKCKISDLNKENINRVYQMQMKTNQFNLTTKRVTNRDIIEKIRNKKTTNLIICLEDKFTDHGLISYLEYEMRGKELIINDWLMSCRVFSRTLEEYIIKIISKKASDKCKEFITINYIETNKNLIMRDILKKLGFSYNSKRNKKEIWKASTVNCMNLKSYIV